MRERTPKRASVARGRVLPERPLGHPLARPDAHPARGHGPRPRVPERRRPGPGGAEARRSRARRSRDSRSCRSSFPTRGPRRSTASRAAPARPASCPPCPKDWLNMDAWNRTWRGFTEWPAPNERCLFPGLLLLLLPLAALLLTRARAGRPRAAGCADTAIRPARSGPSPGWTGSRSSPGRSRSSPRARPASTSASAARKSSGPRIPRARSRSSRSRSSRGGGSPIRRRCPSCADGTSRRASRLLRRPERDPRRRHLGRSRLLRLARHELPVPPRALRDGVPLPEHPRARALGHDRVPRPRGPRGRRGEGPRGRVEPTPAGRAAARRPSSSPSPASASSSRTGPRRSSSSAAKPIPTRPRSSSRRPR